WGQGIPTGTHWASPSDFPLLKSLGYSFAVVAVDPDYPYTTRQMLDAAETTGLKLIIGGWPPPYSLDPTTGEWSITPGGVRMLNDLAARSNVVMAVFVFNEPYWTNATGTRTFPCGWVSAQDLRNLRLKIKSVWPEAKIYHDLDAPSEWAPGG